MLALEVYEDGLCSCGQPTILSHGDENDGWYEAHKIQCQSCATQERATSGSSGNPYVPEPGEKVYTSFDAKGKAEALARRAPQPLSEPL